MAQKTDKVANRVKHYRQRAGLSQAGLAELAGVKRQAIYDIESGRYLPNTGVALKLARHLSCRVEDLFYEPGGHEPGPVILGDTFPRNGARASVVRIRDRLVAYPVDGRFAFTEELRPADGFFTPQKPGIHLFTPGTRIDRSVLVTGCDPALSLLAAHVARQAPGLRMNCWFASSKNAIERLDQGLTHMAGLHLHNRPGEQANVALARKKMAETGAMVIGFSTMEEGLMVAQGNPLNIRTASDLADDRVRFVNREPGAALRVLLDDLLVKAGLSGQEISGYTTLALDHNQGAQMVAHGLADAALGLRPVAQAHGLDFVVLAEVRCDLVVPADLSAEPGIQTLLNVLASRDFRDELAMVPGYSHSQTGATIDAF